MKSVAVHGASSGKDKDKCTGRGEQVTEHYLSRAVTNNGRKNYRKLYVIPLKLKKMGLQPWVSHEHAPTARECLGLRVGYTHTRRS